MILHSGLWHNLGMVFQDDLRYTLHQLPSIKSFIYKNKKIIKSEHKLFGNDIRQKVLISWLMRLSDSTHTDRYTRRKIPTCSPDDRYRLTGSLWVYGVDANRVRLILLQAINHMRGGVALQRLLIDHSRSVDWGDKPEKCSDLISVIHIIIAQYWSLFSTKSISASLSKVKANTWWKWLLLTSGDEDFVRVQVA